MLTSIQCPECGLRSDVGATQCPRCSLDFASGSRTCLVGHAVPDWSPRWCPTCGGPVEIPRTRPVSTPAPTAPPPGPPALPVMPEGGSVDSTPDKASLSRGSRRVLGALWLVYLAVIGLGLLATTRMPPDDHDLETLVGVFAFLGLWVLGVISVAVVAVHLVRRNAGSDRKVALGFGLILFIIGMLGRAASRRSERIGNQPYTNDRAKEAMNRAKAIQPGPWNNGRPTGRWRDGDHDIWTG